MLAKVLLFLWGAIDTGLLAKKTQHAIERMLV